MLENDIETRACALVYKHLGVVGSKLNIPGNIGYPDRIFWIPGGKPLLIEFKRPNEKPRSKQLQIHAQLRALGYNVEVHTDATSVLKSIIKILDTPQLPEASRKILGNARAWCAAAKSRARQNGHNSHGPKNS